MLRSSDMFDSSINDQRGSTAIQPERLTIRLHQSIHLSSHSFHLTVFTLPMFTPPPSPEPPQTRFQVSSDSGYFDIPVVEDTQVSEPLSSMEAKRVISRRTKWTVITVPLVLILITCTTRSLTHPALLDIISGEPVLDTWSPSLSGWRPHKRHPEPMPQAGASSGIVFPTTVAATSTAAPATTSAAAQAVPTIPSTAPTLPTPFPQPFDSNLQANFTSLSCQNFFENMTNTQSFRSCRPFGLLLQSSASFTEVQCPQALSPI